MRRGRDSAWLEHDGKLLGVNLGSDFCAEHEWGIAGLKRTFGITTEGKVGVEARKVSRVPADLHKEDHYLWCSHYGSLATVKKELYVNKAAHQTTVAEYGIVIHTGETEGGWSERDFGLWTKDLGIGNEMYTAFQACDIALLFLGGQYVFGNAGLGLLIASRIPQQFAEDLTKADQDGIRLQEAAAKTGIAERLKNAGRRYYALSPRWDDKAKGTVKFWLNPMEQDTYNYGWYGVKELDQWAEGEGPIVKNSH